MGGLPQAWVGRYGDIYERYEPVFHTFAAAAESDEAVAGGSARLAARCITGVRSRLSSTTLPPRQVDPVVSLLVECVTETCYQARILRAAMPESYPRERVQNAVTDVMHRTLFGVQPAVNVHGTAGPKPRSIPFDPSLRELFQQATNTPAATDAGQTMTALMAAGSDVFVQRGYHGTRVDDIVAAAGSLARRGYRYFDNKAEFAHVLAAQAMQSLSTMLADTPAAAYDGSEGKAALRRWLRRYNAAQGEFTRLRSSAVWVDATAQDQSLGADSAPGRRLGSPPAGALPCGARVRRCRHRSSRHDRAARRLRRAT